LLTFC